MDEELVGRVRRFNRTVTHRVGALHDHYLARDRPLGESRLLWEIGGHGCEVRTLRGRLDLDSGYLSRLLRSLEADALIEVGPSEHDQRVRSVRLTKKGRVERAVLDRRSDALAWSMLEALNDAQRRRLVAAMDDVDRLLTAALVQIASIDPAHPDAQHCLNEYFAELDRRFDAGFDPARSISAELEEMRPPAGAFLVAKSHGEAIGCGALKFHTNAPTELKRMWVDQRARWSRRRPPSAR